MATSLGGFAIKRPSLLKEVLEIGDLLWAILSALILGLAMVDSFWYLTGTTRKQGCFVLGVWFGSVLINGRSSSIGVLVVDSIVARV